MKTKVWFVLTLMLFSVMLIAGCAAEKDTMKAAEIYTKSLEAMQQANSYVFEMEMTQVMQFPEPVPLDAGIVTDKMETQSRGIGKATQKPLAMEMTMEVHMSALADVPQAAEFATMEMKMYWVDDEIYIYYPMFDSWIRQDMREYGLGMGQLEQLNQAANDPMFLLTLLGEDGAAKASLETDDKHYVLTLKDDEGALMMRMMDQITNQLGGDMLDPSIQAEMQEAFNNMEFSNIDYKIWIDQGSYLAAKTYLSYSLTMNIEGEALSTEQFVTVTYKDYNSFDSIVVPEEVSSSAMTMEELFENMMLPQP
ncbi:MAG: DUF6612 family protein [Bacillota bacterium]